MLRLIGSALLIIVVVIFGVFLIKLLLTICLKKCCAASPLTQAMIIINSELLEDGGPAYNGEGGTQGLPTGSQIDVINLDLGLQPFLLIRTDD